MSNINYDDEILNLKMLSQQGNIKILNYFQLSALSPLIYYTKTKNINNLVRH